MNIKNAMKLYLVTDTSWSAEDTFLSHIHEALEGGITCLQLREKALDRDTFVKKAENHPFNAFIWICRNCVLGDLCSLLLRVAVYPT